MSATHVCARCASLARGSGSRSAVANYRRLHTSAARLANPLPVTGAGPPPPAPQASAATASERIARKRAQAELVKQAKDVRAAQQPSGSPSKGGALQRRFWKEVSVQTQEDGSHTINLDQRPVRTPLTKSVLPIPPSKPHLATAIALEWDNLTSAQQALKAHNIPLTSIASRAVDLEVQDEEMRKSGSTDLSPARTAVVNTLLKYLNTDTLLCWDAENENGQNIFESHGSGTAQEPGKGKESLRQMQIRTAQEITSHLTSRVWPGVTIKPVLESDSIFPTPQPQETRAVIRGWLSGLGPWELAGLERAVLATKSFCIGSRLLVDWAESLRHVSGPAHGLAKFGIEQAAEACSLEVAYQTARWGEVEDSHDVEKEDLRRQLGSTILTVSGTSSDKGIGDSHIR